MSNKVDLLLSGPELIELAKLMRRMDDDTAKQKSVLAVEPTGLYRDNAGCLQLDYVAHYLPPLTFISVNLKDADE